MLSTIRAHWLAVPTAILVILAGLSFVRGRNISPPETYIIDLQDLREEVSVTGKVRPTQEVSLSFQQSGQVRTVNIKVGDIVLGGALLASLDNGSLSAQIAQAQASVRIEEASLAGLKFGDRPEDVRIARVKFETAQQTLANKSFLLADQIDGSFSKLENAFRYYIDQFFSSPKSASPQLNFQVGAEFERALEEGRMEIESTLINWKSFDEARESILRLRVFVAKVAEAINALSPTAALSVTTIDGYKVDVASIRSSIESELVSLSVANQSYLDAQLNVRLTQEQYELAKSPAREEDIISQEARLAKAESEVRRLEAELSKVMIYAPFSGLITEQDYQRGETVSSGDSQISLISNSNFRIEANIPEADIAGIRIGQRALVNLEAYGDEEIFEAKVISIDPAETVIEGVPTYRTTLEFVVVDERIKSGMTANTVIITNEKKDIMSVPNRFIYERDKKKYIWLLENKNTYEKKVVTGLRSVLGYTEIISGLEVGQTIVYPELYADN